jgi:hypothetical protein
MLQSVRGTFEAGVARPAVSVERRDGEQIIITFLLPGNGQAVLTAVRGRFHNGVAQPDEKANGEEGQEVIITFLEEKANSQTENQDSETAWRSLEDLIDQCAVHTGIPDLAHQHDHYLYGTPKKEDPYLEGKSSSRDEHP